MSVQIPQGEPSRPLSGWAIGLSVAAIAISCAVAGLVAAVWLFGAGAERHGWFAYTSDSPDMGEMGDMSALLNDGSVVVDATGGVAGEVIAGALARALDPSQGPLTCRDVVDVTVDATSVCTQENLPGEKVVVLFVDDRGRFVWSQVPVDASAYLPQD